MEEALSIDAGETNTLFEGYVVKPFNFEPVLDIDNRLPFVKIKKVCYRERDFLKKEEKKEEKKEKAAQRLPVFSIY